MVEQCGTEGEVVRFEGAEASEHPENTLGHTSRLAPTISTVLRKTISQLYFCSRMFPRRDSLQHRRKHVLISDFHLQRALQKENTASRTSSNSVNDHRVSSLCGIDWYGFDVNECFSASGPSAGNALCLDFQYIFLELGLLSRNATKRHDLAIFARHLRDRVHL